MRAWAPKQWGSAQAIGRSKVSLSTKIHAAVDALGNPIGFHLTGGQAYYLEGTDVLLPQLKANTLLVDPGFDADQRVLESFAKAGKTARSSRQNARKQQRAYDQEL